MKNKNNHIFRILVFVVFLNQLQLSAQNMNDDLEKNINSIFFNLNVNACQRQIIQEIDSNKTNRFTYSGKFDTFGSGKHQFIWRENSWNPSFRINENYPGNIQCDSAFIGINYSFHMMLAEDMQIEHEILYGYIVSIFFYIHDSTLATKTYKQLTDSISHKLKRTYSSGDFTIGNTNSWKYVYN